MLSQLMRQCVYAPSAVRVSLLHLVGKARVAKASKREQNYFVLVQLAG